MDRPLALTRDPDLADELARLAAAAGVPLDVLPSGADALRGWATAPVVLVGADVAAEVVAVAPGRRPGVYVVTWTPAPRGTFRDALLAGAERVVELPAGAEWVTEALTDLGEAGRPEGALVGVVGGSGGAGATTLACALGQVAGGGALVVDLDPLGPGCDRILALDEVPGVRWDSLGRSSGRLSGRSLREAVPRREGPGVLAWPPPTAAHDRPPLDAVAVREALSAARRGHGLVVVDLPRSTAPAMVETLTRCELVVVVAVPTMPGVAAATAVVAALPQRDRAGLVVRGSGADPGRVAEAVGVPLLAMMPDQRGLAEAIDLGLGPVRSRRGPLARTARDLVAGLATPRVAAA